MMRFQTTIFLFALISFEAVVFSSPIASPTGKHMSHEQLDYLFHTQHTQHDLNPTLVKRSILTKCKPQPGYSCLARRSEDSNPVLENAIPTKHRSRHRHRHHRKHHSRGHKHRRGRHSSRATQMPQQIPEETVAPDASAATSVPVSAAAPDASVMADAGSATA